MVIQHTMLLWGRSSKNCHFNDVVNSLLRLKKVFDERNSYIENLMIKYKEKYVNWEEVNIISVIKSGVNKEGNEVFPDLGFRINFKFNMYGVTTYGSALLGSVSDEITNTIKITIPYKLNVENDQIRSSVIDLFAALPSVFDCYWGAIVNNYEMHQYDSLYVNHSPVALFWVNYLNDDLLIKLTEYDRKSLIEDCGAVIDGNILTIRYLPSMDDANPYFRAVRDAEKILLGKGS